MLSYVKQKYITQESIISYLEYSLLFLLLIVRFNTLGDVLTKVHLCRCSPLETQLRVLRFFFIHHLHLRVAKMGTEGAKMPKKNLESSLVLLWVLSHQSQQRPLWENVTFFSIQISVFIILIMIIVFLI